MDMVFLFFLKLLFYAKTNPEALGNVFKARKILRKFSKFPEIDWDTNNPNKVFGAHEKDFSAS